MDIKTHGIQFTSCAMVQHEVKMAVDKTKPEPCPQCGRPLRVRGIIVDCPACGLCLTCME